jgi:precorrin-6B methylase 2
VTGWVFAHRPSNRQRNRWAVSLLGVRPADQVLEIGFGPGLAVAELARAGAGHVYGIDHSDVMLRQASKRNAAAVRTGRVTLVNASADLLPAALGGPSTPSSPSTPSGSGPRPPGRQMAHTPASRRRAAGRR